MEMSLENKFNIVKIFFCFVLVIEFSVYVKMEDRTRWFWITESDVQFWLYTRNNPTQYQVLVTNDSQSLRSSNFDFHKKVKIIVHGWISNGTNYVPDIIKTAYLISDDYNVIVVDWSRASNSKYIMASYFVNTVGWMLTEFLNFIVAEGIFTEDVQIIGHSLGAHVAGIAGGYYNGRKTPLDAIVGLDPAYPFYKYSREDQRLDKSDARHVEVIHTCAGFLGFPSPLGHIDYYPNGGRSQPGCGYDLRGICAHDRSATYFAESIISIVPFTSVMCENYEEVYQKNRCEVSDPHHYRPTLNMSGHRLNYGKEGVYYFKTKSEPPYALGDPSHWNTYSILDISSYASPGICDFINCQLMVL